jgi:radical SAM protein with 4Fe4S-binding SPASM domain
MRDIFADLPVDEWDPIWPHGWAGVMQENEVVEAQPYGENYHPCNWLWKSLAIYWDGRVASCCADFTADQVIGNLKTSSLMDVWNGPEMVKLRTLQVEGRYKEAPLCAGCDAVWQKDTPSWSLFDAIEKQIRPSSLPTGRMTSIAAPAAGEAHVSPHAAELGPQTVASIAAARNGFTGTITATGLKNGPIEMPSAN